MVWNTRNWLIQIGLTRKWSFETFLVEYDGDEGKHHRIVYIGPLYVSWEGYPE